MIPGPLMEAAISEVNVTLWTLERGRDLDVTPLIQTLVGFARIFGICNLSERVGLNRVTLWRLGQRATAVEVKTLILFLSALGLRLRVERDPNPRFMPIDAIRQRAERLEKARKAGTTMRQNLPHLRPKRQVEIRPKKPLSPMQHERLRLMQETARAYRLERAQRQADNLLTVAPRKPREAPKTPTKVPGSTP